MARTKRRRERHEILSPYAHHPHNPGKFVLYIDYPAKNTSCVYIYAEAYGARRHVDILTEGSEYTFEDSDTLLGIIDDRRWLVAVGRTGRHRGRRRRRSRDGRPPVRD